MRNTLLQLLVCILIVSSSQIVMADNPDKFDPKSAELNLLKEEEAFLNDLLKDDNEPEETTKSNIQNKVEESKITTKDDLNTKKEEPTQSPVLTKTQELVSKPIPSPTRSYELSLKEK